MAKQPFLANWDKVKYVSVGLVVSFFLLWLIFHTEQYVPEGQKDRWFIVFISYGLLLSVSFGVADIRNRLYNTSLIRFLPRFFIFFAVSYVVFYMILYEFNFLPENMFSMLRSVPLWLLCLHAFVFATIESAIWQGYLDYQIGRPASALTAGVFHWGIWSGGAMFVIPSAGLLFLFFSWVNWQFSSKKDDLAPVIGVHTAYNFSKLIAFVM